ncbi:hypothetical protein M2401_001116 [Pseudomonas sp. JUb42]|uniref:phage tail assembly chaperone n=1 Tax=Pseudomonas sp. JUb42 TaxID=2940611 RepID=UPI0021684023|nr:phage tail assembly chaperone [Pseudomonas sp. JUb42]MCS3467395.1 hypothetical protein [Pseudomonas sp. JUb42]
MSRAKVAESSLRTLALDPLRNFKHEVVTVPEWLDAKVTVRALSAGDWLEYRRRAVELVEQARIDAGLSPQHATGDNEETTEPAVEFSSSTLYAFVLARTLFDEKRLRVFEDDDVPEIAEAFSPVHDRLVGKAFELSGVEIGAESSDPVDIAGNV